MNFRHETERLILKALPPSSEFAEAVLDFYSKNRAVFEQYEAARPSNFYTKEHQKSILTREYNLALEKKSVRFWAFEKANERRPVGTVCFYNIARSVYDRCETGYKFDRRFWGRGYAKEAMTAGIFLMFGQMGLHRVEAYVMEENLPSVRLLKSLGFQYEGICRQYAKIRGNWEDCVRFAKIRSELK